MSNKNTGKIIQIIGPVLDVEFSAEHMPAIYNALHVKHGTRTIVLEVMKHIEPGKIRAISLDSTDGLKRGLEAHNRSCEGASSMRVARAMLMVEPASIDGN